MHDEFAQTIDHADVLHVVATRSDFQTLLFAGGGVEIKGVHVILQALPRLFSRWPKLRLVVAGGGEEHLLQLFRQFAPRVQVLGHIRFQDMKYLMASADLMLVPSTCHENSPMTILESMQLGTPVVGTDLGGIPELVQHNETGYLFPVGDAAAFGSMIDWHLERPAEQRRRMRHACVKIMKSQFALDSHTDGIINVYREAMG
jgi:glycosyltransferase involved in cell wall biosynthesis